MLRQLPFRQHIEGCGRPMDDHDDLIGSIYQSAAVPELWPSTLDKLAAVVECDKAMLFSTDGARVERWICNEPMKPGMETFIRERWMERNPQGTRVIAQPIAAFQCDDDLFSRQEIETHPYYLDYLRPHGMAWGTGTVIEGTTEDIVIVSIHRPYEEGPVDRARMAALTRMRPHIARASLISARLGAERSRAAVSALEAFGLPAATLNGSGGLRATNGLFDRLAPALVVDLASRLRFQDRDVDELFIRALDTPHPSAGRSFPHKAGEGHPPLVVHLVPILGHGRDVFASVEWLLALAPPAFGKHVSTRMLAGLFDLTSAESRVVAALMRGASLAEMAGENRTAVSTVRSQLKSVFQKTGTHRQSELVALLNGIKAFDRRG